MTGLPTGRRGQVLAVALTLLVMALVWLAAVAPLLAWYADRSEHLHEQEALAARMAVVAATTGELQRQLAQVEAAAPSARSFMQGGTDAVAGAALQGAVQDIAGSAGAMVASAELLPAEQAGAYRRLSLHVVVGATWPVLTAMLHAMLDATPRMLVDDLSLRQTFTSGPGSQRVEATFSVVAFSAGQVGQ